MRPEARAPETADHGQVAVTSEGTAFPQPQSIPLALHLLMKLLLWRPHPLRPTPQPCSPASSVCTAEKACSEFTAAPGLMNYVRAPDQSVSALSGQNQRPRRPADSSVREETRAFKARRGAAAESPLLASWQGPMGAELPAPP